MLHSSVFGQTLLENRRAILWWSLGFVVLAAYMIALFPTVRDNPAMQELGRAKIEMLQGLIGKLTDFGSPSGYLTAGLFSLMLPMMFLFFTITMGANAIGGEEERKTLDLLLANPISRSRIVIEKWGAMTLLTLALGLVILTAFAIGGPRVKLIGDALSMTNLVSALVSAVLLALFFGTLALAVGAATGSRAMAWSVAGGIALANYLVKTMAETSDAMKDVQTGLPLYYYLSDDSNPLQHGLNLAHAAVLLAGVVVCLAVALVTFQRRDVGV